MTRITTSRVHRKCAATSSPPSPFCSASAPFHSPCSFAWKWCKSTNGRSSFDWVGFWTFEHFETMTLNFVQNRPTFKWRRERPGHFLRPALHRELHQGGLEDAHFWRATSGGTLHSLPLISIFDCNDFVFVCVPDSDQRLSDRVSGRRGLLSSTECDRISGQRLQCTPLNATIGSDYLAQHAG